MDPHPTSTRYHHRNQVKPSITTDPNPTKFGQRSKQPRTTRTPTFWRAHAQMRTKGRRKSRTQVTTAQTNIASVGGAEATDGDAVAAAADDAVAASTVAAAGTTVRAAWERPSSRALT